MKTKPSIKDNRGSALVIALVVTVMVAGMAGAFITLSLSQSRSTQTSESRESALSLAESGLDFVVFRMTNWAANPTPLVENVDVAMAGGQYRFEVTPDFAGVVGQYTVVSTGSFGGTRRRIEAVVAPVVTPLFGGAAFGRRGLTMNSNARNDGYNSSLGTYASQAVNGSGSSRYANQTGSIGSNGNITLDSNSMVWGNATPGPGMTVIGSSGHVSGSTQPAAAPKILPPVVLPPIAAAPGTNQSYNGNGSHTINPGEYHFSSFSMDSNVTVTIKGPATLVCDSFEMKSNVALNIDASAGPVKFFMTGQFVVDSNTTINNLTQKPSDLEIQMTTNNQSGSPLVDLNSNSKIFGTIYAPNANFTLDSNGELFGAIVANYITQDSNYRIHYDEALSGGVAGPYRARNWREVVPN